MTDPLTDAHPSTDDQVIGRAVASRLTGADSDIAQALAYVSSAHISFTELAGNGWLADPDLIETGAGDDALDRLAQAAADLRDAARIIENRRLRQQQATTTGDHP